MNKNEMIERMNEWVMKCEMEESETKSCLGYIKMNIEPMGILNKAMFNDLWAYTLRFISCGDVGADWDYFDVTWNWILTGEIEED